MTSVARLYALQQLDAAVARLEAARASVDDGSALRARVEKVRAEEDAARADLHGRRVRLRDLELQLQAAGDKAARVSQDLYGGRIHNPKELAALQDELEALTRQRRRLEDEILTLMEEIEEGARRLAALEAARRAAEAELEARLAASRRELQALEAELLEVRRQREEAAAQIDPALLRRYERLRERKDGVAVAAVSGAACGACHVALPEALLARLQQGDDVLLTCEECGRILYVPAG
ncbi:MAG: C4-type zinc ribbon domain-containing protein [Armatimonadota bacterium]|nr:C4-type zinc ribbon domain-containing protein [Armatimonadota bacterium]MDR7438227.1 C4-type zinc ribbon domain-containing protein [Armatimonadota bacterium]MDR7506104.1 C4-type zinc ribbon domain-containing protein [Armatimonadota bacterium]MDR7510064.1 C4-type zinc ribbon domain-containing protein [Armatimonadota bacterium]MDR7516114.1 C4-type zinc ribbon domain-containing protein [Armatimonadota bacterium]